MMPGRFLASSMKSWVVFQGESARTAKTVGSAVKRAMALSYLCWNMGLRPSTVSAVGKTLKDESAMRSV